VNLLERVTALLSEQGVAHALIDAAALAVHGVGRSTIDRDLLVVDGRVLNPHFWTRLQEEATIDARRGDEDDPLAGVVRIGLEGERDVDVVVGRHAWQEDVLARAMPIGDQPLRVAQKADLILLKLYAGGSQDRWDIEQLLALDSSDTVLCAVDARVMALPTWCREVWVSLRPRR